MQSGGEQGRTWAMFMTAGGHFAGAIVRVRRPDGDEDDSGLTKKGKPKRPKPDVEVLRHKTFHRYTSPLRLSEIALILLTQVPQHVESRVGHNQQTTTLRAKLSVLVQCSAVMVSRPCET